MPQSEQSHSAISRTSMGFVSYCFGIQQRAATEAGHSPDLRDPLSLLAEVKVMGGAGLQLDLGVRDKEYLHELRKFSEANNLSVEGSVGLPKTESDMAKFEQQIATAAEAGAAVVRTVILSGRRYEQFHKYSEFKRAMDTGEKALQRAEPVMKRHKLKLAVENHKDQRTDERLKVLNALSSEYIGACLDVGNNIALLEDPIEVATALAPWTLTVHFKDQAVKEYENGFLLADTPLGTGCIDLPQIVHILREKCPRAQLNLELITRDPLKVPILTAEYWSTFPEVTGKELARTLRLLKEKSAPQLETISSLPLAQQIEMERSNLRQSIEFASEQLKL